MAAQGGGVAEGRRRRPDLAEDCRARASAAGSIRREPAAWATTPRPRWWTRICRVHDVDNVYVVDGSVHVTNGGFNPVLTIMAHRLPRRQSTSASRLEGGAQFK